MDTSQFIILISVNIPAVIVVKRMLEDILIKDNLENTVYLFFCLNYWEMDSPNLLFQEQ